MFCFKDPTCNQAVYCYPLFLFSSFVALPTNKSGNILALIIRCRLLCRRKPNVCNEAEVLFPLVKI